MLKDRDIEKFIDFLREATSKIDKNYFNLPTAGNSKGAWRERVYCYELYHQLRLLWPRDFPYTLNGEVDKAGHYHLTNTEAASKKPDLLVHVPGSMDQNLAVVEVKATAQLPDDVEKDFHTLKVFKDQAKYGAGILLLFGDREPPCDRLRQAADKAGTRLEEIYILHHKQVKRPAIKIESFYKSECKEIIFK
jgi:hypothetical protein